MTARRQSPDRPPRPVNATLLAGIGLALMAPLLAAVILTTMMISRLTARTATAEVSATPAPTTLAAGPALAPTQSPADQTSRPLTPSPRPTLTPTQRVEATAAPVVTPTAWLAASPPATVTMPATRLATATPSEALTPIETPSVTTTPVTPTATPTTSATADAAISATPSHTPTASATATQSSTPSPTPAPMAFVGTRAFFDSQVDSFRVVGEVINNTTFPQQLVTISGVFYDAQGQVLADGNSVLEFFPQSIIPPGDRAPFELLVDDVTAIARYELMVDYVVSLLPVRQDLIISNLAQTTQSGRYCLTGALRNPGARMTEALIIVAVLYDTAGQVVNFSDYILESPLAIFGAQPLNFEVCVPPPNEGTAQAQVRAWGR